MGLLEVADGAFEINRGFVFAGAIELKPMKLFVYVVSFPLLVK